MPSIKSADPAMEVVKTLRLQEIEDNLFRIFDMIDDDERGEFMDNTSEKGVELVQELADIIEEKTDSDAEKLAVMCHMTISMFASIVFNYSRWLEKIKEDKED